MGDGTDDLSGMSAGMAISITAGQMRAAIAEGKKALRERAEGSEAVAAELRAEVDRFRSRRPAGVDLAALSEKVSLLSSRASAAEAEAERLRARAEKAEAEVERLAENCRMKDEDLVMRSAGFEARAREVDSLRARVAELRDGRRDAWCATLDALVETLGSVCRRSGTGELVDVLARLGAALPGVLLHGFGVKSDGVVQSAGDLAGLPLPPGEVVDVQVDHVSAGGERRLDLRPAGPGVDPEGQAHGHLPPLAAVRRPRLGVDRAEIASVANSQVWAEAWRAAQCLALCRAVVDRMPIFVERGQMSLFGVSCP